MRGEAYNNIIYQCIVILGGDFTPSDHRRHGKKRSTDKIIHENENTNVRCEKIYFS